MTGFPTDALRAVVRTDTRPAYVQIAEQLRRAIREAKVEPGTQLPSEPELVQRFGVSRMTVREGIRVLRQEDVLRVQHGVGVFVGERRSLGATQTGGALTRSEPDWREAVEAALHGEVRVEPVDPGFEMWAEAILNRPHAELSAIHLRIEDVNLRPESIMLLVPGSESSAVSVALDAVERAESWIVSVRAASAGDGARNDGDLVVTRIARHGRAELPTLVARSQRSGSWAVTTIDAQ